MLESLKKAKEFLRTSDLPSVREGREFMRLAEAYIRARRPWLFPTSPPVNASVPPVKPKARNSINGPWLKRKEAIAMLGARSVLEDAEGAGWLKAVVRRPRLVLYNRQEVLACVYRLSQGEYPKI